MANFIFTTQPISQTVVPAQNTTLSVAVSADYSPATFVYRWSRNGSLISGATSASYSFDAPTVGNYSYVANVSALSGTTLIAASASNTSTLSVSAENLPFANFAYGDESGSERFKRLRHLGYV